MAITADSAPSGNSRIPLDDENGPSGFELRRLLRALRRDWMAIFIFAAAGVFLGVLFLRGVQYSYPVRMQLTTVQSTESQGGSALGSLGSLAGLAGGMPSSPSELDFRLFADTVYTRDIADILAKNHQLMTETFPQEWDPVAQTWHPQPISDFEQRILDLRSLLGLAPRQPWHAPDGLNMQNFIRQNVSVYVDPRKPYLITITMVYPNTEFAMKFLNVLWRTADDYLRQRALVRAREDIAYLSSQLARVTVAEHRAALTAALSEQEKFAMTASSNAPFSAELFEKPWASAQPAAPVPREIFLVTGLFGATLGALVAFATRRLWRLMRRITRRFALG